MHWITPLVSASWTISRGVDTATVVLTIGGVVAWTGDAQQSGFTVTKTPVVGGYCWVIDPAIEFLPGHVVIVGVYAEDVAGNVLNTSYSFTTTTLASMTQQDVGDRGGWTLGIGGAFPVGAPFQSFLGPVGDETDPPCYGGQGNGHEAVSSDGVTAEVITTPCAAGVRYVTVRISGVNGTLPINVIEEPVDFRRHDLSKFFPPWQATGRGRT